MNKELYQLMLKSGRLMIADPDSEITFLLYISTAAEFWKMDIMFTFNYNTHLFADPASARTRVMGTSRALRGLPGPGDILRCSAAVARHSEPSIYINHSALLLSHPHTNTARKYTHLGLRLVPPFRIAPVYVTMCTKTRFS